MAPSNDRPEVRYHSVLPSYQEERKGGIPSFQDILGRIEGNGQPSHLGQVKAASPINNLDKPNLY